MNDSFFLSVVLCICEFTSLHLQKNKSWRLVIDGDELRLACSLSSNPIDLSSPVERKRLTTA